MTSLFLIYVYNLVKFKTTVKLVEENTHKQVERKVLTELMNFTCHSKIITKSKHIRYCQQIKEVGLLHGQFEKSVKEQARPLA